MKIPDNIPDKYDKLVLNARQLRQKLATFNNAHIDSTDNKTLFKEMRAMIIDIGQILKIMNGIQKDDDTDI